MQGVLQGRAQGVQGRAAAFAHALGAVKGEGGGRFLVGAFEIGHGLDGERGVIGEGAGDGVALLIVGDVLD